MHPKRIDEQICSIFIQGNCTQEWKDMEHCKEVHLILNLSPRSTGRPIVQCYSCWAKAQRTWWCSVARGPLKNKLADCEKLQLADHTLWQQTQRIPAIWQVDRARCEVIKVLCSVEFSDNVNVSYFLLSHWRGISFCLKLSCLAPRL